MNKYTIQWLKLIVLSGFLVMTLMGFMHGIFGFDRWLSRYIFRNMNVSFSTADFVGRNAGYFLIFVIGLCMYFTVKSMIKLNNDN